MTLRGRWAVVATMLVSVLIAGVAAKRFPSGGQVQAATVTQRDPSCDPVDPCCQKFTTRNLCLIGCPGPAPKKIVDVKPDLSDVAQPYPTGLVIIEATIDERGVPISACVLRRVRPDFDRAAQLAVLRWRFEPKILPPPWDQPVAPVMTVTVEAPHGLASPR
jgi:TonB family protein